jgi:hypothetical protein
VILGGGVLLWIAICCGWNAPRPSQPPDWEAAEPIVLRVAAPEQQAVELLGEPVAEFTVEIDAVPQGESTFNGYGLIFRAQSPDRYAVFAVGSDGYVAVLARDDEQETPWLDWRAFPHVRRGEASNRLRVTCGAGECHFWVNDEHVASLPDRLGPTGRVGVWASRQTRAPLEVTFNALSVWEEIP